MVVVEETTTDSPVASLTIDTIPAPPADATPEEKEAFEAQVDVYSGAYDEYVPEGSKQTWTLAGVGLVLITLSGPTLRQALWLTGVALVLHSILTATTGEKD